MTTKYDKFASFKKELGEAVDPNHLVWFNSLPVDRQEALNLELLRQINTKKEDALKRVIVKNKAALVEALTQQMDATPALMMVPTAAVMDTYGDAW